jgi:hypothetical protein
MTYVLITAKLDVTGHRWVAALAAFNFNILFRPGKKKWRCRWSKPHTTDIF